MRAGNFRHRATFVYLIDEQTGRIFVQKRSKLKRYCPGYWDICFGGCVTYGKSNKLKNY